MAAETAYAELASAVELLAHLGLSHPLVAVAEADNAEYGASISLGAGGQTIRFRVGKVTPTKVGLFVATWRRASTGETEPFSAEEPVDLLVVVVRDGAGYGAFVLPKAALVAHDIVSVGGVGGKRGFRLYPPWSPAANPQAKRSQLWQNEYFLDLRAGAAATQGAEQEVGN